MLLLSACASQAVKSREPLPAEEIMHIAKDFKSLIDANREAHLAKDFVGIEALFTEDMSFDDYSFEDHLVGTDQFMGMTRNFLNYFKHLQWQTTYYFISLDKIVTIAKFWDMNWMGKAYKEENPFIHVFLFEPQGDLISAWRLFYSVDFLLEQYRLSETEAAEMETALSAYASAWSSMDSKIIAEMYASNVVCQDTLFDEYQDGRDAIQAFAESFITWYPNAHWTSHQMFGESAYPDQPQTIGSSYTIEVTDPTGDPCQIMTVVLLQVLDGKIIHEELYYEPDTLIACGWAR